MSRKRGLLFKTMKS